MSYEGEVLTTGAAQQPPPPPIEMTTTTTAAAMPARTAADLDSLQLGCHLPSLQAAALLASADETEQGLAVVQVLPVEGGGTDYVATDGHVACWFRHEASHLPAEGPGSLGYVVQASDVPQRNLGKAQLKEGLGMVEIIHRGGQDLIDLGGKLQPVTLHLITEREAAGRRKCTGFSDWLPNVLGVWPAETEPGLPGLAFNANLMGRISKAADKLASQELITQRNRPEVGRHPILKPRCSGGGPLCPIELRLSDSKAFVLMPVQIRD